MSTPNLHVVVLAGGKGTRFWPLSTPRRPKQFLRLFDDRSLLLSAVERVLPLVGMERIWISTDEELIDLSRTELVHLSPDHFVVEPVARNTLPGIALACSRIRAHAPDAVIAVVCADHLIRLEETFRKLLLCAAQLAQERESLITFGIQPTRPETGYGYIQYGVFHASLNGFHAYEVERFTEKPDLPLAEAFLRDGHYLWNSGMFVWRVDTFFNALRHHQPQLYEQIAEIEACPSRLAEIYPRIAAISVDYGLMEKADNILVIPAEIGWDDVGSWEAIWNVWQRDENDNAIIANHIGVDTQGCVIFGSKKKTIATVGLDNLIIVETDEALLICPRERAQEVRTLAIQVLDKERRK